MTFVEDILFGAISGGVNKATFALLNISVVVCIVGLFGWLVVAILQSSWLVPHIIFMIFLAFGLALSINWFILNIGFVDPKDQQKELFGQTEEERQEKEQQEKDE
eukprot:TRINITY_DN410_c0_g1_i1.p8 TRINITY_DN410_c0_g1~~TRINITY_DN410_c0_g1_i1.p8  ORF type:complete len:105 (-),score=18.30 TRINITY_DN410_c0_g1_i1:882-1196(-)